MSNLPEYPLDDNPERPSDQSPNFEELAKSSYEFNVTVVGEFGVGKTSLIQRFINNSFDLKQPLTNGVKYYAKVVQRNSSRVKLKFWDTPGRLSALETYASCFREADLIVLVYDVTSRKTFAEIENWLRVAQSHAREDLSFFLVGTKCELNNRVVFHTHVENFALQNRLAVYEVSALQNSGVDELFDDLVNELIRTNSIRVVDKDTFRVNQPELDTCCFGLCSI